MKISKIKGKNNKFKRNKNTRKKKRRGKRIKRLINKIEFKKTKVNNHNGSYMQ